MGKSWRRDGEERSGLDGASSDSRDGDGRPTPADDVIDGALTDNPALTRSVLGTADPEEILCRLDAFCEEHLASGTAEVLFCGLGTGASFGLLLLDGRRIFLKAHPPERPEEYLRAMYRVQGHLHERGFPAPRPLLRPASFGIGLATVDEFVDAGETPDGHDPGVRRTMAKTLYRLIELAAEVEDVRGLDLGWNWPPPEELWSEPHNAALFDFVATARGAEWIDALAADAKRVVDDFEGGELVVGHADWSVDQMRFEGEEVAVVYDWDSLRPEKEVVVVGIAASNFTSTWHAEVPDPPSPEETRLFVEDYERARGAAFSEEERRAVAAAAIYAVAYLARCEHALDQEGHRLAGSFREALPVHASSYFRSGFLGA